MSDNIQGQILTWAASTTTGKRLEFMRNLLNCFPLEESSNVVRLLNNPIGPENDAILIDICLQTDIEEDPEVYYFAGGRHVSSQTDYDDEYEPLIPFVANTKLEIIVLTSPLDSCASSNTLNEFETESSEKIHHVVEIEIEKKSVEIPLLSSSSSSPITTKTNSFGGEQENDKSKSQILVKPDKDGWKTVTPRSSRTKWSQSSSSLGSANSSRGSLDRGSIGDYRDRVSIGSASNHGSMRGRLNSSGSGQIRLPSHSISSNVNANRPRNQVNQCNNTSSSSSGRGPSFSTNARSAANYLKSRFYQPSSTISLPVLNHPHHDESDVSKRRVNVKKNVVESGYSSREKLTRKKLATNLESLSGSSSNPKQARIQRPTSQQRSTQTTNKAALVAGNGYLTKLLTKDDNSVRKPRPELVKATTTTTTTSSSASKTNTKQRAIMSNLGKISTSGAPGSTSFKSNNLKMDKDKILVNDKTNTTRKLELGVSTATTTVSGRPTKTVGIPSSSKITSAQSNQIGVVKKSAILGGAKVVTQTKSSTASKTENEKEKKTLSVVKNIVEKSEKLSGVLSEHPVSGRESSESVGGGDAMQESTGSDFDMTLSDKWKEQDTESSNDDEEIQLKDAALESAMKESELLAEELLQVEKDFEEIENRGADNDEGSTISEHETASSPSTFLESENDNMSDFGNDLELDQFFFVAIDENSTLHSEETIEERIARKEKLRLSPAKKCDSAETLKRHRAKLAKAERNRERLLQAKYNRYVELSERFSSLNDTTKRLVEERAELMLKADERRNRAAEKRKLHLKSIVKKAHDEDSKAKEIAFINLLEAQNKRHDFDITQKEVEDRLNSIQEERKLKFEDRNFKVQAVIDRQAHIRHDWESKLAIIQEKRRQADERILRTKEEKAKERSELAQEKARDREERLSALNAAKQAEIEELQKKIQQKQEETARRHEENIEQIRQKAMTLTLPRTTEDSAPATVRMCSLCKVTMQSEVQELAHLRGRPHLEAVRKMEQKSGGSKIENFGLKYITDVQIDKIEPGIRNDKNRNKKHCKKLMLRLVSSGEEFEKQDQRVDKPWGDPSLKAKVIKNLRELDRAIILFSSGKGTLSIANSMDKLLTDIRRTVNKNKSVQDAMVSLRAFTVTSKILQCSSPDLPPKILIGACNLIVGATYQHLYNGIYVLRGTVICSLIDLVVNRLNNLIPDGNRWLSGSPAGTNNAFLQSDSVADFAIETLFTVLSIVPDPFDGITRQKDSCVNNVEVLEIILRTQDIIGYLVASNVIDRLSVYCSGVQGPVDNQPGVANLLKISLDFLTALVWCLTFCLEKRSSLNGGKKELDPTQLLATLESSDLAGSVSMSYALLLYQGAPSRPRLSTTIPPTSNNNNNEGAVKDEQLLSASSGNSNSISSSTTTSVSSSIPSPPGVGVRTASVVKSTLCLVNAVARLDIQTLQNVLGSEAMSLQFRHIASQLLWQVVPHKEDRVMLGLLQELFIAVGNFTVKNNHNQVKIQSGQTPTVLQQLCGVAKEFLSDLRLSRAILPTLIAASHGCPENRALLEQEDFPTDLLDGFLESKFSHANILLKRLVTPSPLEKTISLRTNNNTD